MIIIISVLEMVDLYRKDRSNFASRKVDLGLGETIKLYCIQAHKVIEQDNRLYLFISTTRQAAALKIREIITCLSRSTSLIYSASFEIAQNIRQTNVTLKARRVQR